MSELAKRQHSRFHRILQRLRNDWLLYALLLPVLIWYLVFCYLPMGGASFDQIFNLYSSPVYPVADIIDTYVYRQSFSVGTNFGYTTAVGLLKSVIGVVMVYSANKVTTKMGETGLF